MTLAARAKNIPRFSELKSEMLKVQFQLYKLYNPHEFAVDVADGDASAVAGRTRSKKRANVAVSSALSPSNPVKKPKTNGVSSVHGTRATRHRQTL